MNAIGIICEYNPFHLGHARMLEGLRRQYDAPLVCAMSGNFVQRGDAAVAHKHARGEMAVRCGADLVLELPTPWAMASAERFADGGVALLTSTGVVSHLAFGSECGDLTALQAAEAALSRPELMPRIRQLLAQGMAYAPARQQAAEELGAPPRMLSRPNDILAIEYLKALRRQKAPMEPLAVLRQGAGHDGTPSGDTASASYLRTLLRSGRTDEASPIFPPPRRRCCGGNWRWDRPRRTFPIANGLFWPGFGSCGRRTSSPTTAARRACTTGSIRQYAPPVPLRRCWRPPKPSATPPPG